MEKKINVAEILKDCPKGVELDCTIWDSKTKVFLKEVLNADFDYPIVVTVKYNNIECSKTFTKYGTYNDLPYCKCVIFPKGKTTWEGFVPPCKFKDGDIITTPLGTCIFKGEGKIKGTVDYYCGISGDSDCFRVKDNKCKPDGHYGNIVGYRLATEEEKQKLFQAIKDNGYKWNEETKTLEKLVKPKFKVGDRIRLKDEYKEPVYKIINIKNDYYVTDKGELSFSYEYLWELVPNKFDISTLKPFESRVLIRNDESQYWIPAFWGYKRNDGYVTTFGWCKYCIPFDGNENLLGTTEDCDEYFKTWK